MPTVKQRRSLELVLSSFSFMHEQVFSTHTPQESCPEVKDPLSPTIRNAHYSGHCKSPRQPAVSQLLNQKELQPANSEGQRVHLLTRLCGPGSSSHRRAGRDPQKKGGKRHRALSAAHCAEGCSQPDQREGENGSPQENIAQVCILQNNRGRKKRVGLH